MRLALAEVVSAGRRSVAGLRHLRDKYGQIQLISHGGGPEDEVDLVLEIRTDGEERTATLSGLC